MPESFPFHYFHIESYLDNSLNKEFTVTRVEIKTLINRNDVELYMAHNQIILNSEEINLINFGVLLPRHETYT